MNDWNTNNKKFVIIIYWRVVLHFRWLLSHCHYLMVVTLQQKFTKKFNSLFLNYSHINEGSLVFIQISLVFQWIFNCLGCKIYRSKFFECRQCWHSLQKCHPMTSNDNFGYSRKSHAAEGAVANGSLKWPSALNKIQQKYLSVHRNDGEKINDLIQYVFL